MLVVIISYYFHADTYRGFILVTSDIYQNIIYKLPIKPSNVERPENVICPALNGVPSFAGRMFIVLE